MVTLKEIAEECGVSVSTVSNVLNGRNKSSQETTDRVMKVVREDMNRIRWRRGFAVGGQS